jgi:glycosyltransferase involved in cell wall biosynthesis
MPSSKSRYSLSDYKIFENIKDFKYIIIYNDYRQRDPRYVFQYLKAYKMGKKWEADLFYMNVPPSLFYPFVTWFYNKNKTIYCAHDGAPQKDSVGNIAIHTCFFNHTYKAAKYVNMFSKNQADLYRKHYPQGKIHVMRLALKDFGRPTNTKPKDIIRFLSVGYIIYQKHIDLLIDAACILFEKGHRNFRISINGACDDWHFYEKRIKYPEIFECTPSFVDNADLPNLYESSHYAVFPYRRVSQSGALKVAFNYNIPVITADMEAFKEEVVENVNGFLFKPSDVEDLVRVMSDVIDHHENNYNSLCKRMKEYTDSVYSDQAMIESYKKLFNSILESI